MSKRVLVLRVVALICLLWLLFSMSSCSYHEYACPAHYKITQYYSGRIHDHGPTFGR